MKYFSTTKGFTLVETLVAVTMLTIAIASTMSVVQTSLASNSFSQQQITANYLAGEAIEYIRNIRDTNILNGAGWLNGINAGCFGANGCTVDTVHSAFSACGGEGCAPLKLNTDINGYYQYQTGDDSPYTRTIFLNHVNGTSNEISIEVIVSGKTGLFAKAPLVVVEHLYDWGS